jgi:general secretion pathway protein J
MRRAQRHAHIAGFTLVEALVAMLLMGMVLASLATITAQWLPSWNRGFTRVENAERLSLVLERLAGDLSAAEFVTLNRNNPRPLFEGSELGVTFVRSAIGPNARGGLEVVQIAETTDRLGPVLVRAHTPFVPADKVEGPFTDPVVLLRAPYRITLSYAGADREWKGTWSGARELPSAVRFAIRDGVSERTLLASTATVIHTQLPALCANSDDERRCGRSGAPKRKPAAAPGEPGRDR